MAASLGPVTTGTRQRLTYHYGPSANEWLDSVPKAISSAAAAWNLTVMGYHDVGCASVVVLASDGTDVPHVIKAWYDPGRYRREVMALRFWGPPLAPVITHAADHLNIATLEMVAGRPGGVRAPAHDHDFVADGLRCLHSRAPVPDGFPRLESYLEADVLPRIHRRATGKDARIPESCLLRGMAAVNQLPKRADEQVLLHADLYRENVLFHHDGRPVFIDPLPMAGDPAFDWAFWTVYYDLARDPSDRLIAAARTSGMCPTRLLPWCLMLCLDGLLYYLESADPRTSRMIEVMTLLGDLWAASQR